MTTFADLQLSEPLCRALAAENYEEPTEIQSASIPHLLSGGDLLGSAQTGTGKTASFALPVLQAISKIGRPPKKHEVRALVLTPTRELAVQVSDSFRTYGKFTKCNSAVVYGGVGYGPQIKALRRGVDVLVATPGRLIDLLNGGHMDLGEVRHLILDEADRMLDMGFKKDLETIIEQTPNERQTIFFSATMPAEIEKLARRILNDPKRVNVSPKTMTAHNIDEQVMFVKKDNKNDLLIDLLDDKDIERAIVFTRTKHVAERLTKKLNGQKIRSEAIHGNKSQNQRQRSLTKFKKGRVRILVATDVAARGIDVDGITHVFNYQLSNEAENYVHRIGRTARAGKSGTAVTLCDAEDTIFLRSVERLLKRKLTVNVDGEFHDAALAERHLTSKGSGGGGNGRRFGRNGSGGRGRSGGGRGRPGARGAGSRGRSFGGGARRSDSSGGRSGGYQGGGARRSDASESRSGGYQGGGARRSDSTDGRSAGARKGGGARRSDSADGRRSGGPRRNGESSGSRSGGYKSAGARRSDSAGGRRGAGSSNGGGGRGQRRFSGSANGGARRSSSRRGAPRASA